MYAAKSLPFPLPLLSQDQTTHAGEEAEGAREKRAGSDESKTSGEYEGSSEESCLCGGIEFEVGERGGE